MRKHRHGKGSKEEQLHDIDSPEAEIYFRDHDIDDGGDVHYDLVDESESSGDEGESGDFKITLPFDDLLMDVKNEEDSVTKPEEESKSVVDDVISPTVDELPLRSDVSESSEDNPHFESTDISGSSSVKVQKTVVDTLIVNNVIGGKGFGGQPVNVTVNTGESKHNIYSLEELSVPESQKGKVVSAKDEQVVKEYNIVKNGKAIVTSRRLIIDSDYRLDIPIERVGGVSSSSVNELKVGKLIFGAIFVIIMAISLLYDFRSLIEDIEDKLWIVGVIYGVGIVLGIIGIILLATCFRRRFAINIYTDSLMPIASLQNETHKRDSVLIKSVIYAKKGKEFDKFTGEFGALLIQLKDALENRL